MSTHRRAALGAVLALVSSCFFLLSPAQAQDSLNEAHVLPGPRTTQKARPPDLTANVDLVLVPVTVLDQMDRTVAGLRPDDFILVDSKVKQTIRYFSSEDTPISLTVILDASGSMKKKAAAARTAAMQLFQAANPQDEFRLMTFGDQPRTVGREDDAVEDFQTALVGVQPHGLTALWDTMYLAIMDLKKSQYERKAIILITDGGDNHSRHTQAEIKSLLKEAGVQAYALGVFDINPRTREEKAGPLLLDEVSGTTGGRLFSIYDPAELEHAVAHISLELRNQYVLGYYPSNRKRDGKWRKLKVQLAAPAQPGMRMYARKGYYGPAD